MRIFSGVDDLRASAGTPVGVSDWITVRRTRSSVADATGDHQWIHVDAERAKQGPFGTTIAHGFLTLSLLPMLIAEVYRVEGVRMGVNYGLNRVRFTAPVPVDSQVRGNVELLDVSDVTGGVQVTTQSDGRDRRIGAAGAGRGVADPAVRLRGDTAPGNPFGYRWFLLGRIGCRSVPKMILSATLSRGGGPSDGARGESLEMAETITLTGRDRAVLRAVAAGRCRLGLGYAPELHIDGFICADVSIGHRLLAAGLICPGDAAHPMTPIALTEAGRLALAG